MDLNLQFFGGRGSGGGKSAGGGQSNKQIIASIETRVKNRLGDKYTPLTPKETANLNKKLEAVDNADFSKYTFGDQTLHKVDGVGQMRFIDHGSVDSFGNRYEINFKSGGITYAYVGKTKADVAKQAKSMMKEEIVKDKIYKKNR